MFLLHPQPLVFHLYFYPRVSLRLCLWPSLWIRVILLVTFLDNLLMRCSWIFCCPFLSSILDRLCFPAQMIIQGQIQIQYLPMEIFFSLFSGISTFPFLNPIERDYPFCLIFSFYFVIHKFYLWGVETLSLYNVL